MKTKDLISLFFTGILVLCALMITGLVVRKEFFSPEPEQQVRQIENWRQLEFQGQRKGPSDALVQIIEFFDYQCPFCKSVQPVVEAIMQKYPNKVSFIHEHFPLDIHEYAFDAAVAAECAGRQKRFSQYHDLLFAHQDQIGQLSYDSLAIEAGVQDTTTFNTCLKNKDTSFIVESGLGLAKKLRLNTIPTFLINGKLVAGALPQEQLEALVEESLTDRID